MGAVILAYPISPRMVEDARLAVAVARYRLNRICEELDARNPGNWSVFQEATQRVGEAEARMRAVWQGR